MAKRLYSNKPFRPGVYSDSHRGLRRAKGTELQVRVLSVLLLSRGITLIVNVRYAERILRAEISFDCRCPLISSSGVIA